jgi:hypothetical protein
MNRGHYIAPVPADEDLLCIVALFTIEQAMKALSGSRGIAVLFL